MKKRAKVCDQWDWLQRGSIQQRRRMGRRYLLVCACVALAANCALLAWFLTRYLGGTLQGSEAFRCEIAIPACFVFAAILLFAARSK
jgi:hypothetical protein